MIAVKGLTNNHSIVVWDINDESVTVSVNQGKQSTLRLYETNKGTYFNYLGSRQYLFDFIRTGGN